MPTLSKSRFLSGSQCEKKLFFDVFRKELKPAVTEQQQALFDSGHLIGSLAQQVFQGGRDASEDMNGKWAIAIDRTKQWMHAGIETIYEAAFSVPRGFAALDILHHQNGERWAIEVKSSTSVKAYHITDASYQYFVMKAAGYAPDKFFLMHVNNTYVKDGAISPEQLFTLQDITQQVIDNQPAVALKNTALLQILKEELEPKKEIGSHCASPFHCDYIHHCWAHLPETSVFELRNARGKDWALYDQGIHSLADVPDDFSLSRMQEIQVRGVKYNEKHVDAEQIRVFLDQMKGPLYFFDFETINPAVPVLNGTRPFRQVPFQYSLHQCDVEGNILHSSSFLADHADFKDDAVHDPRLLLIQQLKKDIGPEGSIIAYNASFEKGVLQELALAYETERAFIESLLHRFVDLLIPFQRGWYYLPEMGDSASIKSVLPAIAPEFSYKDLPINNGGLASDTFQYMIKGGHADKIDEIRNNLLVYCERDTEGMVVIYRELRKIVSI